MRKILILALAAVLAVGAAGNATAQKFELGARAGIGSQNLDDLGDWGEAKTRLGWHVAAVSRIRILGFGGNLLGAGLYFQPEIVYSQNSFKVRPFTVSHNATRATTGETSKVRMATVDVPLMLSLKVSLVRVQAGPVFNLMNNFNTTKGNLELQPLRPAVGYALGASVDLLGLTIDGRYHGEFKKLDMGGDWKSMKSSFSSWSLGVGIMF